MKRTLPFLCYSGDMTNTCDYGEPVWDGWEIVDYLSCGLPNNHAGDHGEWAGENDRTWHP